ncbi:MAG: hypothetical protein RL654_183 [Pseudomonadota bacterium]|jgi:hypothetical protein
MFDDLGMVSVLVQLLLILVLVALYSGRRHRRRCQQRDRDLARSLRRRAAAQAAVPAAPVAAAPCAGRISGLRSDDLLPASFADTCADWTALAWRPDERAGARPADRGLDRIDLDEPLRCTALERPFEEADRARARARPVLSCTIGRQVHMRA